MLSKIKQGSPCGIGVECTQAMGRKGMRKGIEYQPLI
jgi:hypothetical protein